MASILLFAAIREAAGCRRAEFPGTTVGEVLDNASRHFDNSFREQLRYCSVLVGEEPADVTTAVGEADQIALLPPVSGG